MKIVIESMSDDAIVRVTSELGTNKWYDNASASDMEGTFDVTLNENTIVKSYCGEGMNEIVLDFAGGKEFIKEFEFYRVVIE